MNTNRVIVFVLFFSALSQSVFAADEGGGWKVGLSQVRVTPAHPVVMSGYGGRTKPSEGVAGDLYVKALVIDDGDGHRAAIVTSDLLGFSAAVAEPICVEITKKAGLKRDQILLTSSHTHAGPLLSLNPADQTGVAEGEALRSVAYTKLLQQKVVDVVTEAAANLEPAHFSFGSGVINFVMNRREFTPNGVILGVNPRGLADRSVPVLRIDTPDGNPRAVLFGAAVHNTTLGGDNYQICGDYAGFTQAYVEEQLPDVQSMFVVGCAGDANPYPRGTMEIARQHGEALGKEVCRVLETKLRPISGPLKIAYNLVALPLQTDLTREKLESMAANKRSAQAFCATKMLAALDRGEKLLTHYDAPVTVWQFGDDLTLVALSGEVVVDYVTLIEKAIGPNKLWIAAYANDVFGYLPSARVLAEGGYETRGLYSGGAGYLAPEAEQTLVKKVRELATSAGRKMP